MKQYLKKKIQWLAAYCGLPTFHELNELVDITDKRINSINVAIGESWCHIKGLEKSLTPVVLFTGACKCGNEYYDNFSFAIKAADGANENLIINFQPDTTIRIKEIQILNGLYDIIAFKMCNVDMLHTREALIPYDGGIMKLNGPELAPCNRLYMELKKRN